MKTRVLRLLSCLLVLIVLSALAPGCGGGANIGISDLNINPSEVDSGQVAKIEAKLANSGKSEGKYNAVLKVNEMQVDSQEITLAAGETRTVSFTFKAGATGQYKIDLNGLAGNIQVVSEFSTPQDVSTPTPVVSPTPPVVKKPAEFKVESMDVPPAGIIAGSPFTINAVVANIGQLEGIYSAKLILDGTVLAEKDVKCNAGTSQKVEFTAKIDKAGNHTLELGGIRKSIDVSPLYSFKVKTIQATPEVVFTGQEASIEAEISNDGAVKTTPNVSMSINGIAADSRSQELEAGQSVKISFKFVRDIAGNYTIKIGDSSLDLKVVSASTYSSSKYLYSIQYPASWTKQDSIAENILLTGQSSEKIRVSVSLLDVEMIFDDFVKKENESLFQGNQNARVISKNEIRKDAVLFGLQQEYSFSLNGVVYSGNNLLLKRGRYCFNIQGETKEADWKDNRKYIDAALLTFQPPTVAVGSYSDDSNGYSIQLPAGWDGLVTGQKAPSLIIYNKVKEQTIVSQIVIESQTATAREYVLALVEQLKKYFQDIKIESQAETRVGQKSGYGLTFSATYSSSPMKMKVLSVINGSQTFTLMTQTITLAFVAEKNTIDALFSSFTVSDPKPYGVSKQDSLFLWEGDIITLDPALTEEGPDGTVGAIFSGLVQLDKNSQPAPDLAEKWEISGDKLTYTFHLRKNAAFHNGKALTARDVKFAWERACDPAVNSPKAGTYLGDIVGARDMLTGKARQIDGIKVIDDFTLQVQIDGPKPYFLAKLAQTCAFVVDQVNVSQGSNWFNQPNGSGPFKIKQWTKGQLLILERNDSYYLGAARLKNIVFKIFGGIPVMMYENGEIDVAQVSLNDLEKVTDPSNPLSKELLTAKSLMTGYLVYNVNMPPFDDLKIRQAFTLALDMNKLVEVSHKGEVERSGSLLPPGMPGYNADLKPLAFDAAQARKLLAESSYGSVEKLPPVIYYAVYGASPIDEAMVAMWKQNLGVDVKIEVVKELAEYFKRSHEQDLQLFLSTWSADYLDPQNFLEVLFHSQSKENRSAYANPEIDSALAAAAVEGDSQKRLKMYQEIEKKILSDLPVAPFFSNMTMRILVKPYLKGLNLDLFGQNWKDLAITAH